MGSITTIMTGFGWRIVLIFSSDFIHVGYLTFVVLHSRRKDWTFRRATGQGTLRIYIHLVWYFGSFIANYFVTFNLAFYRCIVATRTRAARR